MELEHEVLCHGRNGAGRAGGVSPLKQSPAASNAAVKAPRRRTAIKESRGGGRKATEHGGAEAGDTSRCQRVPAAVINWRAPANSADRYLNLSVSQIDI